MILRPQHSWWMFLAVVCGCGLRAAVGVAAEAAAAGAPADDARWWKVNLHTHTFWSDGDDFPEMVADWYRERGGPDVVARCVARFGEAWLERR